jgi:pimeloyl-ACP methyl ester carboxylesterase
LASYPGIERAAGAYKLTAGELEGRLKEFNPIDRLSGLAKSKVPLFAIHGNVDTVVPLELNSGKLKSQYAGDGGPEMELIVPEGQGHNMWEGFFQCKELVDFVLRKAR